MSVLDKFSHANHNYKVCNFLNSCEHQLNDWIVTTAFYSSIHYCQNGLFPGEYYLDSTTKELNHYRDFRHFFSEYKKSKTSRKNASPHKCRRWLIEFQVDEISYEYLALDDICHTARYTNYRISDDIKDNSIKYLEEIKNFLS